MEKLRYQIIKSLQPLLLSATGILLGLFLIEASLRVYQYLGEEKIFNVKPSRTTLTWIEDPDIGNFILKPNSSGWFVAPSGEYYNFVSTNSFGFYDSDHQIPKKDNTYRILILGDSFVASLQTPLGQTFFKQLERALNSIVRYKRIEVIPLGMGDTGPSQQYLALKKIGLSFKPDLVIHFFLTANDLKDDSPNLEQDQFRPYFIVNREGNLQKLPHFKRKEKSFFYLREFIKKSRLVELALLKRQELLTRTIDQKSDYPIDYHVYDKNWNKDYQSSWLVTKRIILESKKITEESGGNYLLVTLANNEQVNQGIWQDLEKTYSNLKSANLDLEKPDKEIKKFCKEKSLDCLQMLPSFKKFKLEHSDQSTHYRIDGHWNQIGTNLTAQILINFFKDHFDNYFSTK